LVFWFFFLIFAEWGQLNLYLHEKSLARNSGEFKWKIETLDKPNVKSRNMLINEMKHILNVCLRIYYLCIFSSLRNLFMLFFYLLSRFSVDIKLNNTICVRIKNYWRSFSNIQIASQTMDSYRKKNEKDIYFFCKNDNVNKKRTGINLKHFFHKISSSKKSKEQH
jgi:hypothetical protein